MGAGTGTLLSTEVFRIEVRFRDVNNDTSTPLQASDPRYTRFVGDLKTLLNQLNPAGGVASVGGGEIVDGVTITLRGPISTLAAALEVDCALDRVLRQMRMQPPRDVASVVTLNIPPVGPPFGPQLNDCPE
jgi:hypothetical protein